MNGPILTIDTTRQHEVRVLLEVGENVYEALDSSGKRQAQAVLPLIDTLLSDHGVSPDSLTDIRVATGPGSFTGIRVGLSVANTLATLYGIPVNGKRELARASYS